MTTWRSWRPIALAIVSLAALAGPASAQTVVIRGVPAGGTAEVIQGAARASGKPDAGGDAVIKGDLTASGDTRVTIFVDACENARHVVLVERDGIPPAADAGCTRTEVQGLFVLRPVSTLVVNLRGTTPLVLLRQGEFDFRKEYGTGGVEPPSGLIVFGSGAYTKLHNAHVFSCGDIAECPGADSGFGFGGGISYWLTPYVGVEASYLKPRRSLFEGAINNSLFQSIAEPHVLSFVAKLGVPAGPVRIYGQGGATFHRAKLTNTQESVDGINDRFELRTNGWGWTFGGGIEAWVHPRVGFYAEGGRAALKGPGVESAGEGRYDERMTFVLAGLRVNVKR
jgi:opacity protein-like surface antigen